jgi:MOSC domain-containing protein YiiM
MEDSVDSGTTPCVAAVCRSTSHEFSKSAVTAIRLIRGEGVEHDTHRGTKVQHRSRVRRDPDQPNLRQVHLLHSELLEALINQGYKVGAGVLGENITTTGVDLLSLSTNTVLKIGTETQIKITGLRNPCAQLDHYQKGLTGAVLDRTASGDLIRKAGIMAIVLVGGTVRSGDLITVIEPAPPHFSLQPV